MKPCLQRRLRTWLNPGNAADQHPTISGSLLKSVLIASAEFMTGGWTYRPWRFNVEQGYGRIVMTTARGAHRIDIYGRCAKLGAVGFVLAGSADGMWWGKPDADFAKLANLAGHQAGLTNRIAYFASLMASTDDDVPVLRDRAVEFLDEASLIDHAGLDRILLGVGMIVGDGGGDLLMGV